MDNKRLPQSNDNKPIIGKSFGYWIICTRSYSYCGEEIPKGRMKYHDSTRRVISDYWREATQVEVETKQYYKGNYFNLKFV
jgi:hypothetical protein